MIFGAGVNPGVIGTNPDVSKHNVDMQYDYRQVLSAILRDWMEVDEDTINNKIFFGNYLDGLNDSGSFYEPLPIISNSLVTGNSDFISKRFRFDNLYPNPATTTANLSFYLNTGGQIRIRIFDTQGRVLKTIASGFHRQGNYLITEDISDLKPGNYLVQIEHGLIKKTQKLVKIQ